MKAHRYHGPRIKDLITAGVTDGLIWLPWNAGPFMVEHVDGLKIIRNIQMGQLGPYLWTDQAGLRLGPFKTQARTIKAIYKRPRVSCFRPRTVQAQAFDCTQKGLRGPRWRLYLMSWFNSTGLFSWPHLHPYQPNSSVQLVNLQLHPAQRGSSSLAKPSIPCTSSSFPPFHLSKPSL